MNTSTQPPTKPPPESPPKRAQSPEAWIAQLGEQLQAVQAKNTRKQKIMRVYLLVTMPIGLFGPLYIYQRYGEKAGLGAGFAAVAGFTILAAALMGILGWGPRHQQRRFLLTMALLRWLAKDLKPRSKVRLGLQTEVPKKALAQRWLEAAFALRDGSSLRLRVDMTIRERVKRKRKKTVRRYRVREQLSLDLTLPQAPEPAAVEGLRRALSAGQPQLRRLEVDGPRVRAVFTAEPEWTTAYAFVESAVTQNEDDDPLTVDNRVDATGALGAGEVINLVIQLVTMLRPRSAPAA